VEENPIHKALKNKIKKILENSGFKTDGEIHISFSDENTDDFSTDVCAIHDDTLIVIECKKSTKKINQRLEHILNNAPRLLNEKIVRVLKSDNTKIKSADFNKIKNIRYCYAIDDTESKDEEIQKRLKKKKVLFWNKEAVNYFYNTSKILGQTEKFELLREFEIKPPAIATYPEKAVRIEQNGQELFLLGMHPSKLVEMAYAFRRTSVRGESYQRLISGNKLMELQDFYKEKKNLLLANSVIIAFDNDPEIQHEFRWNESKNELRFPTSYCCAWIIDGQHRVFAFKDTAYMKLDTTKKNAFKIPVVAFRTLKDDKQSRTFVNINYYQSKIKPVLICDLASTFPDATYELSWVSLLIKKLNIEEPFRGKIQTTQTEPKGNLTIAGFAKPYFLYRLLGYDSKKNQYNGPLAKLAKFDPKKSMSKGKNLTSFNTQLEILQKFFRSVRKNSWNKKTESLMWDDDEFGLFATWGINALLLVLTAILKYENKIPSDFDGYMSVIKNVDFSNKYIKSLSRGYGASNELANEIIEHINKKLKIQLATSN
jgi:DNA sulfur modification protein DndB